MTPLIIACSKYSKDQNVLFMEKFSSEYAAYGKADVFESSFSAALHKARPGDTLLVPDLCHLGKTLPSVKRSVLQCLDKRIKLIVVNGNYVFEDSPQNRLLLSAMDMVIRLQSELKSQTVRSALRRTRAKGQKLGRPRGSCNKELKLMQHKELIQKLLSENVSKSEIARRLKVNRMTLYAFLRRFSEG